MSAPKPNQPQDQPGVPPAPPVPQQAPCPPAAPYPPQAIPAQPVAPQPVAPQPMAPPPTMHSPSAPRPIPIRGAAPVTAAPARPVPVPAGKRPTPLPIGNPKPVIRGTNPEDQDEEQEDATATAVKAAPPWLVSLIVHMVALIILALIVLHKTVEKPLELAIYADKEGEQLLDDSIEVFSPDPMDVTEPELSFDVLPVVDPLAAPPDLPMIDDAQFNTSKIAAPSVGMALTGREKGAKRALLAAYGGNRRTEAAVLNALRWLKKQQRADGSWSLAGPYADGAINENKPAATALAMLAFQGAGNTHKKGEFKLQVSRGLAAMRKMMDRDGMFYKPGASPANHRLYTQAQCTIALCELYGMTRDPELREMAQTTLDYASRIQSPEGGWRYRPTSDSDTSVTGWFVMAFQSGLMASLNVKQATLNNVGRYLDAAQSDSGAKYAYQPGEGPTLAMTAEGLLCRQYLGWKHTDSRLRRGVDYLLEHTMTQGSQDVYYWYYATQVLHHMGNEDWDAWNNVMRDLLPQSQVKNGAEQGSWNPGRDAWGHHGGRLYVTCLSVYMLEVYYRHLPIYKHF